MLFVLPAVLGVALGLVTGGNISNLERFRVRWLWFLLAAVAVRFLADFTSLRYMEATRYVYFGFELAIVGWALLQLRLLPGVWVVVMGGAMNLVVIAANSIHMPVSQTSGYTPHPGGVYVVADASTKLNWLGDWIGLPVWLGGAVSLGDFVIALGIGVVGFAATRFSGSATKLDETKSGIRE